MTTALHFLSFYLRCKEHYSETTLISTFPKNGAFPKFLPGIYIRLYHCVLTPPFLVIFVPANRNLKGAKANENPCSVH